MKKIIDKTQQTYQVSLIPSAQLVGIDSQKFVFSKESRVHKLRNIFLYE